METKIPDLSDAKKFSEGVKTLYPHQMLAYNLSPSFNWDASGMTDRDISTFNDDLGKLGYVSVFTENLRSPWRYYLFLRTSTINIHGYLDRSGSL